MPYRMRVFARDLRRIPVRDLRSQIDAAKFALTADREDDDWREAVIRHKNGEDIAIIERDAVTDGSVALEEIEEFVEESEAIKPGSAARWLRNELPKVKVIFVFQVLHGTDLKDGWDPLHKIFSFVRETGNGFSQADLEGFSNDDGDQITWDFSDRVSGKWNMALLQQGKWLTFEMELGDPEQKREFMQGQVPAGAKLL